MRKPAKSVTSRAAVQAHRPHDAEPPVLEEISHRLMEHRSAFRAFLQRRVSDDAVAEDLLQQSLMRAVERHHDLQKTDNAVGWFYRILRNAVVDYYRSQAAEGRKTEGLLRDMVTDCEFVEFLTLPAYDRIVAEEGG